MILCKKLINLLNKRFIHVSWFSAAFLILFIKKLKRNLQFCINYKTLNAIIKKNYYSLPLIYEILNQINKIKWFTKLNIFAAFHKFWITEEQKWLIIFKTCYKFFKWLITLFNMMNAFSTFQWYINWVLHQYLNDFCFVYLNNVLIFINGIWFEYYKHINKMLNYFDETGLFLDIKKCKFKVTRIKYLGFIVNTGVGI